MRNYYTLIVTFILFIASFGCLPAVAQYSLGSTSYSQDFDGLGTATSSNVTGGNLNNVNTTLNGWYFLESGTNANTTITAGTGSSTGGDTYNFGSSGNSNRKLGGLLSGSLITTFGFYFTNNTGGTISQLTINYTGETWRVGAASRSDRLDFQYSTDATSLNSGTWTDENNLDYANPGQATGSGSVQHSSSISYTITGLSIGNGSTFFIRWNDFNATNADDGMAVENFSLTATLAATPTLGTNPSSLSFSAQAVSTNSTSQSFNLSGSNLTGAPGNITVTAPSTDFQVSNDDATWGPTTTIAYSSATLNATPVYVRFTPQSSGAKSGNITFSGGGVTSPPTVAVSGTGVINYYLKSGTITALENTSSWTTDANGGAGSSPTNFTTDGQIFNIRNNATATISGNWTVSGTGSKIIVGDGTNAIDFTIPSANSVTGTIDVANNAELTLENTTLPTLGTLSTGSTVEYAQTSAVSILNTTTDLVTYANLVLSGSGTKAFKGSTTTITGNLTFNNVTFDGASSNPFSTINLGGNLTYNGVVASPDNPNQITLATTGSGTQTITANGNQVRWFRIQTQTSGNTVVMSTAGGSSDLYLGNASGGGVTLANGTILNLNGNDLTFVSVAGVGGASFILNTTGSISATSSSDLTLNRSSNTTMGSLRMTSGANTIGNLTLNHTGTTNTLTIANTLNVTGTITITDGTLASGVGNVVLKSTSITNTARVGTVGAGGSITGDVTVERYISLGQRAYRLMASGVTTGTSIRANWQNNGDNTTPNVGTHITGSTTGANGFDATAGGNYSLFTYTPGAVNFAPVTNTDVNTLIAVKGYRLFIRGDRLADLHTNNGTQAGVSVPMNNYTVLKATGELLTGDVTYTSTGTTTTSGTDNTTTLGANTGEYSLIANPYWSSVDFDVLSRTNVDPVYWAWDPTRGHRGAYISHTVGVPGNDSTSPVIPSHGGSAVNQFIQPGQAIFVRTGGATPSITFTEAAKVANNFTNVFRTNGTISKLIVTLINQDGKYMDEATVAYKPGFSNAVNEWDAEKFTNPDENIAIVRNDALIGVETRADVSDADTIPLRVWQLYTNNSYSLRIRVSNFDAGVQGYLVDKLTSQQHALDMNGNVTIPFSFTPTNTATFNDRFYVVFRNNATLPVSITSVKAYQKNTGVQVEWNVASESNINRYEVEKSADGRTFTTAGTVAARGNNNSSVSYNWFDAQPVNGANYYRVKVVERNGAVKYTSIVRVNIGKAGAVFTMYPNPVKGDVVTLNLNTEKGDYTVEMYNAAGQKVKAERLQHGGGSAAYTIALPNVSAGVYTIRLFGKDVNTQQTIIVENK